jgi:hypothetical protein
MVPAVRPKRCFLTGHRSLIAAVPLQSWLSKPNYPGSRYQICESFAWQKFFGCTTITHRPSFLRVSFLPTARPFINWRAFSLTLFFILLVSLLWEATLAVPYQWWDYQPKQMMGLRIGAWAGLPIEAVCVWIAVTYATVIVFEIVKLWQASEKPAKDAFLGLKNSPRRRENR